MAKKNYSREEMRARQAAREAKEALEKKGDSRQAPATTANEASVKPVPVVNETALAPSNSIPPDVKPTPVDTVAIQNAKPEVADVPAVLPTPTLMENVLPTEPLATATKPKFESHTAIYMQLQIGLILRLELQSLISTRDETSLISRLKQACLDGDDLNKSCKQSIAVDPRFLKLIKQCRNIERSHLNFVLACDSESDCSSSEDSKLSISDATKISTNLVLGEFDSLIPIRGHCHPTRSPSSLQPATPIPITKIRKTTRRPSAVSQPSSESKP